MAVTPSSTSDGSVSKSAPTRRKRLAVVLAAGLASRMGKLKQVLRIADEPLVRRVASVALAADLDGVLVVTGYEADAVREALDGLPVKTVHNPAYEEGIGSSLRAGFGALESDVECGVVLMADQPHVRAGLIDELVEAAFEPDRVAAAVAYRSPRDGSGNEVEAGQRRPGAPCALRASLFPEIAKLSGDRGAQAILRRLDGQIKLIEAPVEMLVDLDTPEAYKRLEKFRHSCGH